MRKTDTESMTQGYQEKNFRVPLVKLGSIFQGFYRFLLDSKKWFYEFYELLFSRFFGPRQSTHRKDSTYRICRPPSKLPPFPLRLQIPPHLFQNLNSTQLCQADSTVDRKKVNNQLRIFFDVPHSIPPRSIEPQFNLSLQDRELPRESKSSLN